MRGFVAYRCTECADRFEPSAEPRYRCESCGAEVLEVEVDLAGVRPREAIASSLDRSLWRYADLLPVPVPPPSSGPLADVGGTPLYRSPGCDRRAGGAAVWLKDDGRLPTGSLKDRASAVVTMRARSLGIERIITASTGNAGVALAAMARAAGIRAVVLVPEAAPAAKIAQLLVLGAELFLVRGSYDDAYRLSREAATSLGWYCRNTAYNPFTAEGKKTVAYEICEQLGSAVERGRWRAPERIYLSVGDGNIIAGVHKGLRELVALGWIERMPRLFGVQAEGSAAVAQAYARGATTVEPVVARTVADSIAADRPADGARALRAVRETEGGFVVVSDREILDAIVTLGGDAAVFAEPAAAAAYAGLLQHGQSGAIDRDEQVVVLVSGTGLKDVAAATRAVAPAPVVDPTLAALTQALAASEHPS
jgi:threonine synthase